MQLSGDVNLTNLFVFGLLVVLAVRNIWAVVRRKKSAVYPDTSLLLSFYTRSRQLMGVASLEANGTAVTYLVARGSDRATTSGGSSSVFIAVIQLPFSSNSHIVGITQKAAREPGLPEYLSSRHLERIALEGNFPTTFMLYAPPGNQFNSRYLLDPDAMEFIVDYCQSQHFEIVDDMLYIASNDATQNAAKEGDRAFSPATISRFVEAIRPVVETAPDHQTASPEKRTYGSIREGVKCPRCHSVLVGGGGTFACPDADGVLLSGKTLLELKKVNVAKLRSEHHHQLGAAELKCPNCRSDMYAVNYQSTGNIIDACTTCGCRWLDQGEAMAMLRKSNG